MRLPNYEAEGVVVEGREIKVWTKLEPWTGGGLKVVTILRATRLFATKLRESAGSLGWGHEHCALCRAPHEASRFGCTGSQGTMDVREML